MPNSTATNVRGLLRGHGDLLPLIALGGAIGSLARWALSSAVPHSAAEFPLATFVINASGALLIGLLMSFMAGPWSRTRYVRPFLGVGVLGGYTTFSTYELDTRGLLAAGAPVTAMVYLVGSILAGLLAVWAGIIAGRLVISTAARRRGHEIAPTED